ncbi:MAG: alpha/beta hydrolase [Candidatus Thorarchaeota archaeon]
MTRLDVEIPVGDNSLRGFLDLGDASHKSCVILLHPHPRYGGDSKNYVVNRLVEICRKEDLTTLKFDFRGTASNPIGYNGIRSSVEDVIATMQYLCPEHGLTRFGIMGYSYGGSVGLAVAISEPLQFLVTLSASADLLVSTGVSIPEVSKIECPVLMFHGENDRVVPVSDMRTIETNLQTKKSAITLTGEGHFYQRSLDTVENAIRTFIQSIDT